MTGPSLSPPPEPREDVEALEREDLERVFRDACDALAVAFPDDPLDFTCPRSRSIDLDVLDVGFDESIRTLVGRLREAIEARNELREHICGASDGCRLDDLLQALDSWVAEESLADDFDSSDLLRDFGDGEGACR